MAYDKRITDLAATAALAAGKNAQTAPQLLLADITFTLVDAVADGRIILGHDQDQAPYDRYADDDRARQIYDSWSDLPGWVPWVERGNSHKQEEARSLARDSDEHPQGEDPQGLSGEAMPARAGTASPKTPDQGTSHDG